ncbi:MAG: peroxiredoxin family protein [Gemmatimonadota bacterium]
MAADVTVGTRVGERSSDWTLPRLDGGELSLRELRGKQALLYFWGSW